MIQPFKKTQVDSLDWTACLFWPQKLSYTAPWSLGAAGEAQWHKRAAYKEEAGRRFTAGKGLKSNKNHNIIEKHEMWRGNLFLGWMIRGKCAACSPEFVLTPSVRWIYSRTFYLSWVRCALAAASAAALFSQRDTIIAGERRVRAAAAFRW